MLLLICMLIFVIGAIFIISGGISDNSAMISLGIIIIFFDIIIGFGLIGTCATEKEIQNDYIYPISVCKTNFETIVTYKNNRDLINVLSSSDAKIFCSTNDIVIKSVTYYNSYNSPISTSYNISLK